MAHWIIDDHGFGGSYYVCSNCNQGYWDILDDINHESCPNCNSPMDEDATVYMRDGKVEE